MTTQHNTTTQHNNMLSIQELCDRYNLASKKTLYTRMNGLKAKGIEVHTIRVDGKSFARDNLIKQLDDLHQHISNGEPISTYQPAIATVALEPQHSTTHSDDAAQHSLATQHDDTTQLVGGNAASQAAYSTPSVSLAALVSAIALANRQTEKPDPLWALERLKKLADYQYEIKTSEVKTLIGIKPKGKVFKRGSFTFVRVGKIGSENAWVVREKI